MRRVCPNPLIEGSYKGGVKEGIKEGKIHVAKKMKAMGMDVGTIHETTGLSMDWITYCCPTICFLDKMTSLLARGFRRSLMNNGTVAKKKALANLITGA